MIRIVTDSASDMTLASLQKHDVLLAPMPLLCGGEVMVDDKTLPVAPIWEKLRAGVPVKTSQPSPDRFLQIFEAAKAAGDEVVCVLMSSALSGTCQTALIAKGMAGYDKVYVVDSRWAAAAEKLLVLEAVRLRDAGLTSGRDMAILLESFRSRIRLYASIDTLDYLVRGGRLSKAAGTVGGLLHLKPYFTYDELGAVKILKKSRGLKRAMEDMAEEIAAHPVDPEYPCIPMYACDDANCKTFLGVLKQKLPGFRPVRPQEIGLIIGAYIGPGGFGVAYIEAQRETV